MKTITLSLRPDGGIFMHLPGSTGDRLVPVNDFSSIIRVLQDMQEAPAISTSGAPTISLVEHWENHENKRRYESRCPFCNYTGKIKRANKQIRLEDLGELEI